MAVDLFEIGTHPLHHDLLVDVDHVSMADSVPVHDRSHLNARGELAHPCLGGEDAHLRLRQIVENNLRHRAERSF